MWTFVLVENIAFPEVFILAGYLATLAQCIRMHSGVPERGVPRLYGKTQRLLSSSAVNSILQSDSPTLKAV